MVGTAACDSAPTYDLGTGKLSCAQLTLPATAGAAEVSFSFGASGKVAAANTQEVVSAAVDTKIAATHHTSAKISTASVTVTVTGGNIPADSIVVTVGSNDYPGTHAATTGAIEVTFANVDLPTSNVADVPITVTVAGKAGIDAGAYKLFTVTGSDYNTRTVPKHVGTTYTLPVPELTITGTGADSVPVGAISDFTVGTVACGSTTFAPAAKTVTCGAALTLTAADPTITQDVTIKIAGVDTPLSIGQQNLFQVSDVVYTNKPTGVQLMPFSFPAPEFTYTVKAPAGVNAGNLNAVFGVTGGLTCTLDTLSLSGAKCGTDVAVTTEGALSVTLAFDGVGALAEAVDVIALSATATVQRVAVKIPYNGPTVTLTVAPSALASKLAAADVTAITVGSESCEATYTTADGKVVCTPGNTITHADFGTLPISLTVLGKAAAVAVAAAQNTIAVEISSIEFTSPGARAVGTQLEATVTFTHSANIADGDIATIAIGADSCAPTAIVANSATCTINFDVAGAASTTPRDVVVTYLNDQIFTAGAQVVRAVPTLTTQSETFATGAGSVTFAVGAIDAYTDVTEAKITAGSGAAVACTPNAYAAGKLTCSLATNLPNTAAQVKATITAFAKTISDVVIGNSVVKPSINSNANRELAQSITELVISGSNFADPTTISINGGTPIAASFVSATQVKVAVADITSWGLGPVVAMATVGPQTSDEAPLGTVTADPTLTTSPRVFAADTADAVVVLTGTNFGTSEVANDITTLTIGGVACSATAYTTTSITCSVGSGLTAGAHPVVLTLKGGYTVTPSVDVTFAAALAVPSDVNVAIVKGVAVDVNFGAAAPFTSDDLSVGFQIGSSTFECPTLEIVSGNIVCHVAANTFAAATSSGAVIGILRSSGSENTGNVGVFFVAAPAVSISHEERGIVDTDFSVIPNGWTFDEGDALLLTFGDGSVARCDAISSSACSVTLSGDVPSGNVTVTGIALGPYNATLSVNIGFVIVPNVVFVQYESDSPLTAGELDDIIADIRSNLSADPSDFRIASSTGPQAGAKRAISFFSITPLTPEGNAATNQPNFNDIVAGAVADNAAGASGVVVGVTTPVAEPQATPSAPPANLSNPPVEDGSAVPTAVPTATDAPSDGVVDGSTLSPGAIAGIVIACVLGVVVIGVILYVLLTGKDTDSGSKAAPKPTSDAKSGASSVKKVAPESSDESEESDEEEEDEEDEEYEEDEEEEEEEDEDEEDDEEDEEEEESGEEESGEEESGEEESGEEESGEEESGEEESGEEESGEEGSDEDSDEGSDEGSEEESSEESS
jgi:hypothetical protein